MRQPPPAPPLGGVVLAPNSDAQGRRLANSQASHIKGFAMLDAPYTAPPTRQIVFDDVRAAFMLSGGWSDAEELARRQGHRCGNGLGVVARWICQRRIVSIRWEGGYWIPLFQFTRPSFLLRPSLATVLGELNPVLDDWDVACWFATANDLLGGVCPARAFGSRLPHVLNAARAFRFALSG
jgi:hypothetical protein